MVNILLKKAKSMVEEGRIWDAKCIYDLYLLNGNLNTELNSSELKEFTIEYIQTL